ncbi:Protein STRUBBELIG-REPTOR FAMILY 6, variant 2 [Ancistrocladus abbreviatus]
MGLSGLLIICILIWVPCSINGETDQADAAALTNMYSGMNSPPQLTGWSSSSSNPDPCGQSWKGVTCSGSRITEIKISGLGLSGSVGFQMDKLTALNELDVSENNLGSTISYQLPPNLQRLNLAGNNFGGEVPYSISQMTSLNYLNLSHNHLQQQLNDVFGKLSSLSTIDLSYNSLPGNLPESFSSLTSLDSLYLENNQFTGTIDVLGNLPLQNLDVSNNQFTGWIPQGLQGINLQSSGNSWSSGPAPPPPPGTPTAKNNHHNSGNNKNQSGASGSSKSGIGGGAIAGIVISLLLVGALVAFFLIKRRSRMTPDIEKLDNQPFTPLASNEMQERKSIQSSSSINSKTFEPVASMNLKPPPSERGKSFGEDDFSNKPVVTKKPTPVPANVKSYSIADLQIATASFNVDNLIGEGSIGRVYRAEFDDGKVLAVKKIDLSVISNYSEDFTEIVANVSRLHHPNVTELVGYCSEHGQHLLIYEFHKNGSLHELLHLSDEYTKPLSWNTRVKIALGSARALEYLHEACSPSVVHKNFKSENILLDAELNPHLTDCGLGSLIQDANQAMNSGISAPEVADSGQYTLKSDVYSFGVVMLELLTGRKPFDSSRSWAEQSLVRWATPQLHDIDALTKMVDPALDGLYPVKSLSRFADVIALCVQPEPEFRPPMSEVVQDLVRLVQRTNMSRRTVGNTPRQIETSDANDSVS